jgi:TonB family protein
VKRQKPPVAAFLCSYLLCVASTFAQSDGAAQDQAAVSEATSAPQADGSASETAPPNPDGGSPDSSPLELHPPELATFVEAKYPQAAVDDGVEGVVALRLTIDAGGNVIDAQVIEPLGHGLDEAATRAALQFRFKPARRGANAVPARIRYHYSFKLPSPPPVAAPAAAPPRGEPPRAPITAAAAPIAVTVRGESGAERLRQSAQAVHVVDVAQAKQQTADLGEVLARSQGVGVQRSGGLGSPTRFSLNGLFDDQIRFFVDGVPMDLAGYPFGIANVPVNLIERVEVYRGVVPVRFGADALGGAVNLVTDDNVAGTHAAASYLTGAFGTHRLTLGGRHLHEPSGLFVRAGVFVDYADNDYPIDVNAADMVGRTIRVKVNRFHDAYRAVGANVEAGVVNRPWARRLLLRVFTTDFAKELQNDLRMTTPYGEADYGASSVGGSLRYQNTFARGVSVEAVAGYAYSQDRFTDVSTCNYDWFGVCRNPEPPSGELKGIARDQRFDNNGAFGRATVAWRFHPQQVVRLALSPTFATRTGQERRLVSPGLRDPLTAENAMLSMVTGLEHESDLFANRLENILFFKDYIQIVRGEEPLGEGRGFRERNRNTHRIGFGDALRFRISRWLYAKASYELATRLPRPDEIFGNGAFVVANLDLVPEVSHNANLGLTLDARGTKTGEWRGDVNGFLRSSEQLILLEGRDFPLVYQNVYSARSLGAELAGGWSSPGGRLVVDGNLTYMDLRNTSPPGSKFGAYAGDRIPYRPYFFANTSITVQQSAVAAPKDQIALVWSVRYVHEMLLNWASISNSPVRLTVPSQLLQALALIYRVDGAPMALSFAVEAQNLTDAPAYDFFGVRRPGRALYFKTTGAF